MMNIERMIERTAKVTGLDVDDLVEQAGTMLEVLPEKDVAAYLKALASPAAGDDGGGRGRSGGVALGMQDDRERPGRRQRREPGRGFFQLDIIFAITLVLLLIWAAQHFLWR